MTERWSQIVGIPTHEISNFGRIRRIKSCRGFAAGHIMTPFVDRKGYRRIMLRVDHVKHFVSVHIAVLEAFVGPRPKGHDGSHKNGIRADNRLENLCWETSSENHQRKLAHGTLIHGEAHKCSKLKVEQVADIRQRAAGGEKKSHLAKEFGVSGTLVGWIVKGKAWPHLAQI